MLEKKENKLLYPENASAYTGHRSLESDVIPAPDSLREELPPPVGKQTPTVESAAQRRAEIQQSLYNPELTPVQVYQACLWNRDADPNQLDKSGRSPLFYARNPETVVALLTVGADPYQPDSYGTIPFHELIRKGSPEMIETLQKAGIDFNRRDASGRTILHDAITPEMVEILCRAGANPNIQDNNGRTPLHEACTPELVDALCQAGANLNLRDKDRKTPIDCAFERRHELIGSENCLAVLRRMEEHQARNVEQIQQQMMAVADKAMSTAEPVVDAMLTDAREVGSSLKKTLSKIGLLCEDTTQPPLDVNQKTY